MAGAGGAMALCAPNPDDEVCPEKCPETCNGEDDDCDRRIDEGTDADCTAPNAINACAKGDCIIVSCSLGYRDCNNEAGDGCETDDADPNHCGACGAKCTIVNGSAICVDEQCQQLACNEGWEDCDTNPADCETATTTLSNCGGCGIICGSVPNAIPTCEPGYCGPGTCDLGFGDCDDTAGSGCEQPLDTLQHCTGCDVGCDFPGSTDDCSSGTCLAAECDAPGFADCDGDQADGCESLDDSASCGGCGKVCDSTLPHAQSTTACVNRACNVVCAAGYGNCNGDPSDGCEVNLVTTTNCGACGSTCTFANGVGDCSSGSCLLSGCNPGSGNCDGSAGNGCETSTNTDPDHCGSCNAPQCTTANGKPYCQGGNCSAMACTPPMADCANTGLSCPDNLSNDANNCGTCGNKCQFTTGTPHASLAGCSSSKCTITCAVGYGDCDGNYANGCERPLDTLTSCGSCNTACSVPNGTATCATRTCQVQACNPDWGDCSAAPGCETPLNTTNNCGACSASCSLPGAIETCGGSVGSRVCQIAGCEQTYLRDCPPNTIVDGCETDVRTSTSSCGACGNNCGAHAHVSGASCSNSACQYVCPSDYMACDADPNNGCETSLRTNADCNGCGVTCARANGTASCSTGACQLTGCNGGYGDCDANAANGCEPLTSLLNCGACGTPCNLANASESCTTGNCQVGTCDASWANCDSDPTNGCERNVTQLGPCFPDTNCVKQVYQGRDYFFCSNAVSWSTARTRCQTQLQGGDLARIDDLAENTFIHSNVGADSWIGGTDATTEGTWLWINDGVPFWSGNGSGTAVGGLFARWASGEPNDSQGQDCAKLYKNAAATNGYWDDDACTNSARFVCEVRGDLCPGDPLKNVPGQCGCGASDTDTDSDGTANCNDSCPNDPGKIAAGQCGCGTSDTDSDSDGTANCSDSCPNDPGKLTPGACGCGQPETDVDGDGTKDCFDGCPYDSTTTAGSCAFDYLTSNFDAATLDFATAPDVTLSCGTTTVFTSPNPPTGSTCGSVQTYAGHYYFSCTDDRNYASAKTQCASIGGSLASIESAGENTFVRSLIGNTASLGGNDISSEGAWRWSVGSDDNGGLQFWMGTSSGSAVSGRYSLWRSGQPSGGTEDCAQMYTDGTWNDIGCTWTGDYVCELESSVSVANWCGAKPTPVVLTQAGGPELAILPVNTLSLAAGATLKVVGARPLVVAALGDAAIAGTIDARGIGAASGGGGNDVVVCGAGIGAIGPNYTSSDTGAGGGGGGAFGSAGGKGGNGDRGATGGIGGAVAGSATLIPLRGGCAGGRGGIGWIGDAGRWGGGAGGAVQISVGGLLTLSAGAVVSASGGGGLKGTDDEDGGGGGGSGGAVLLEAAAVTTASGAWVTANGGGGAAGTSSGGSTGNSGTDGLLNGAPAAPGGTGSNGGGNGGNGGTGTAAGSDGGNGAASGLRGSGGGGGGGGQGRIRVNAAFACSRGHSASPTPSYGLACQ